MKIVVDAMGGDFAPQNVVAGTVDAVKEYNVSVTLVGISEHIEEELKKYKFPRELIEVVHAPEVVAMDDPCDSCHPPEKAIIHQHRHGAFEKRRL